MQLPTLPSDINTIYPSWHSENKQRWLGRKRLKNPNNNNETPRKQKETNKNSNTNKLFGLKKNMEMTMAEGGSDNSGNIKRKSTFKEEKCLSPGLSSQRVHVLQGKDGNQNGIGKRKITFLLHAS